MKREFICFAFTMMLIGFISISVLYAEQGIQGTWVGTTMVPDMGEDELKLVIEKTDDVLTGRISDSTGILNDTELNDIVFSGNKLTFNFLFDDGYGVTVVDMVLTLEGNKLTGYWAVDSDSDSVELARKI